MKFISFLLLFTFFALSVSALRPKWFELSSTYSFDKYIKDFGKVYHSEKEYQLRKEIFEQRLLNILAHNADSTKTWKKGVNHLTDYTQQEFRRLLGHRKEMATIRNAHATMETLEEIREIEKLLPRAVDWRQKNIISAVKDQGQCGSCWTFGTAQSVESYWAMATGELTDLSEQQILDCTPNPNHCGGTGGCNGGTTEIAFQQIMALGGLSTEWTYSYASYHGANQTCKFDVNNTAPFAKISNYSALPVNQYGPLIKHISNVGPLAVTVDASSWGDYETGVFNGCNQTNPDLDHSVQLVGYGSDSDGDYWLIKNSWSPAWGELGYIRIARHSTPTCGVDITPSDGTECSGGPSQVTVCGTCGILYDSTYPIISKL